MFKKNYNYKNPNKYIIKNKRFIKNFKLLYTKIKDPWDQKKFFFNDKSIIILDGLINHINKNYNKLNILDIGAGSGILRKKFKKNFSYLGTDIHKKKYRQVVYDDINFLNNKFINKFNIVFCLKTIYYVSDNINKVIYNINRYLRKKGFIIISYNIKKNSFSNKYLNDIKLRHIMKKKFTEILTIELNRENFEKLKQEKITILIFKKK